MALYVYRKGKPSWHFPRRLAPIPSRLAGLVSVTFIFLGVFLLGQVAIPIAGWYLFTLPVYSQTIVSPLASNFRPETSPIYPALVRAAEVVAPTKDSDSYRPANWFVGLKTDQTASESALTYTLSIPKLQIDAATVTVNGQDLRQSLIAWQTSVTPGNYGNILVFGHSALPALSSPKEYASIFTHLMDLSPDDPIIIDYDGVRYQYKVVDKKIVSPTDLSILEQRFDAPYLTLITCEPPGTLWMRGVIQARLAS